ncbi:MAG TPA: hypothetical protein VGO22_03490 [Pseudorhizobium sp.]|jgi:hypothetical protein|nr:hypothetical protein [Pseudorhizobium sp.]
MSQKVAPTEAEFAELKRRRDNTLSEFLEQTAIRLFGSTEGVTAHVNRGGNRDDCYCGCPDGPCQHEWNGPWREFEDGCGGEVTCARCGMGSMSHDLRTVDW